MRHPSFLEFANFCRWFIQSFSWIVASLISILKTSSTKSAKPRKSKIGVGSDSKARCDRSKINKNRKNNVEVDGGEVGDDEVGKKGQKMSKSKKTVGSNFLTPEARLAFTKLRQVFVKAPILHHFDSEHHIWVETDISNYTIDRVFNQLTLDDLSSWHLVVFFS